MLTPKFADGRRTARSYDTRQKLRDDFYAALTEFGLCLQTALSSRSFFEDKSFSEAQIATLQGRPALLHRACARLPGSDALETVDYSVYEEQIRRMVDKQVIGKEVREPEGVYLVHQAGPGDDPANWTRREDPQRDRHDPHPPEQDHRAGPGR